MLPWGGMAHCLFKSAIAAAVLWFVSPAYAGSGAEVFAGHWVGKGTYIFEGRITQCDDFQMVFNASDGKFVFESGSRTCDLQ